MIGQRKKPEDGRFKNFSVIVVLLVMLSLRVIFNGDPLSDSLDQALRRIPDQAELQESGSIASAALVQENERLRAELEVPRSGFNTVRAEVIGYPEQSFIRQLRISKGVSSGIEAGDAAVINGVMVGVVSRVQNESAWVSLIGVENMRIAVKVGEFEGLVIPKYGGAVLTLLPDTYEHDLGAAIVTSGLDQAYLKNIPLGTVGEIINDTEYAVNLSFSPKDIEFIEVIIDE